MKTVINEISLLYKAKPSHYDYVLIIRNIVPEHKDSCAEKQHSLFRLYTICNAGVHPTGERSLFMPKKGQSVNTGDTYGNLTVTGTGFHINGMPASMVQCSCGSDPKLVRNSFLKNGQTKSCGCLRSEVSREHYKAIGQKNRIYPKDQECCSCGSKGIYAKGLCRNCYAIYLRTKDSHKTQHIQEQKSPAETTELSSCLTDNGRNGGSLL